MDSLKNKPARVRIRTSAWTALMLSLMLTLPSAGDANVSTDKSSYLSAILQELSRLGMKAQCDTVTNTCRYVTDITVAERTLELTIRHSPQTDTIYICFEQFLPFFAEDAPSQSLALKLLALNREMVTAKFEWDEETRTIRLSTVLNTDTNLDRRAFRSQVVGLIQIARTVAPKLRHDKPE
jgi:hypothetical protein